MRVINVSLNELETKVLLIGFEGENQITQVRIDAAEILTDHPNATPTLIAKPLFGFAYPVIVTKEGTDIVWEIDNSVLSFHGDGEIQLTFTEGTVIAKSYVGRIRIKRSLAVTGEAPDPIETWEQAATAKLAEVDAQIGELEDMVEAAEAAKDQAQDIVDDAAADIQAAGAAQVQVVQAAGEDVLESIPSDYTELSGDVTGLKSALSDIGVRDLSTEISWIDGSYIVNTGLVGSSDIWKMGTVHMNKNETLIFEGTQFYGSVCPIAEDFGDSTYKNCLVLVTDSSVHRYTYTCMNDGGINVIISCLKTNGFTKLEILPFYNYNSEESVVLSNMTSGYYINAYNGSLSPSDAFSYAFINLKAGDLIKGHASATYAVAILSKWEDDAFLKTIVANSASTFTDTEFEYMAEENEKIGISIYQRKPYSITIQKSGNVTRSELDDTYNTNITPIWVDGKYVVATGEMGTSPLWSYTDIEMLRGEKITAYVRNVYPVMPLSVWSFDKKLMKVVATPAETETDASFEYICQNDREVVRVCTKTSEKANALIKIRDVDPQTTTSFAHIDKDIYSIFIEKPICVGDSLTEGSYDGHDLHKESYPYYLERLTGWNCENGGKSGASTIQWWLGDAAHTYGFEKWDYTNYDTAIICLGTNGGLTDTIETDVDPYEDYHDYAQTNTGCYCKIIEGIKAQNPSIYLFLCTIFVGGGDSLQITNSVIKKIGAKYDIPVIDLNIPQFSNTHTLYHVIERNIHLGRYGYALMSGVIKNGIVENIKTDIERYNIIPDN